VSARPSLQLGELFERRVVEEQAFAEDTGGNGDRGDIALVQRDDRGAVGEARLLDRGRKLGPGEPELTDQRPEGLQLELNSDVAPVVPERERDGWTVVGQWSARAGASESDCERHHKHGADAGGDAPQSKSERWRRGTRSAVGHQRTLVGNKAGEHVAAEAAA
jgi:hypothetical protein